MDTTKRSKLFGRSGLTLGLILLLIPVLILGSSSNSSAAPPSPEDDAGKAETLPPPQGNVDFETIMLPPEAQFAPANLVTADQQVIKHPKLDSELAEVATVARASTAEAVNLAKSGSLRLSDQRVQVQITTHAPGLANAVKAVTEAGGEVTGVGYDNTLIQGWLPVNALEIVAAQADVHYIRRPTEVVLEEDLYAGSSTTEALDDMNATVWLAAGHTGAGIKVAIIDSGFIGYTGLLGTDLPTSVTIINFVDFETDDQMGSTTSHGTACAEIIHDVAPGAHLYLVKTNTAIDVQEAVNWLIDQGVDVISTSFVFFNLAPGDGTGPLANLVTQARNAGILWVTAAGNYRQIHWGGLYSDPNNDGVHNFNSTQEVNWFGPGDGTAYRIPAEYSFAVWVRWNDWTSPVDQDYDLYLLRWEGGSSWETIAHSTNRQNGGAGQTPTEHASILTSGSPAAYGFYIRRYSSTQTVNFEIFAPQIVSSAPRLDELLNARSLGNLADTPDAVTVAAIDVDPPYAQEPYSSEGPTNGPGGAATGGFIKPDISGYANVSTQSRGVTAFAGTSAATPHVSGAAALVLGAYPTYTPVQLRSFLEGRAIDMGSPGKDTRFGFGRLYLGNPGELVYLPLLVKNYSPPPPTPTPTPCPCPQTGSWSGTTNQGYPISFTVSNTPSCQVRPLTITILVYCSGGPTPQPPRTIMVTYDFASPISNNSFSVGSGGVGGPKVVGNFTSPNTVTGTWDYAGFPCYGHGTWVASH